jgi:hypothetical protein
MAFSFLLRAIAYTFWRRRGHLRAFLSYASDESDACLFRPYGGHSYGKDIETCFTLRYGRQSVTIPLSFRRNLSAVRGAKETPAR